MSERSQEELRELANKYNAAVNEIKELTDKIKVAEDRLKTRGQEIIRLDLIRFLSFTGKTSIKTLQHFSQAWRTCSCRAGLYAQCLIKAHRHTVSECMMVWLEPSPPENPVWFHYLMDWRMNKNIWINFASDLPFYTTLHCSSRQRRAGRRSWPSGEQQRRGSWSCGLRRWRRRSRFSRLASRLCRPTTTSAMRGSPLCRVHTPTETWCTHACTPVFVRAFLPVNSSVTQVKALFKLNSNLKPSK